MAAAFNFALHPEALAEVVGSERQIVGFVPDRPAASAAEQQAVAPVVLNEAEVRLLAATIWGEARSEGEDGMRAVAHVMVNRVGQRFGENLETVIMTPYQFSVWNRGDPNRRLVSNPERYATGGVALETWEAAQRIAREVLSGQSVDPTGGALFYHTRAVRPSWARQGVGRQVFGAHIFYADVPDAGVRRTPRTLTRVTQVAHTFRQPLAIDGPAAEGPRAGRVGGVIQRASASMARQRLPSETIDVNAAATPTINGVPISQQTSLR
ncbi:MAG TPA: cell wall hydrolase [Vitreimonas sp.]|uniref:cell wall hydrolase n=1 Tax=Vitreimonas sp. TaxID=3069702 RepID=UPI002D3B9A3F|nr:cell wall hydrolase [Vitreimonas sp.]HYD87895.1 cell wall hydrolase [Vitreimonas sp.]